MRYSASEKLEIIRLVEQSHLPVRCTLGQIGIPRSTFSAPQVRPAPRDIRHVISRNLQNAARSNRVVEASRPYAIGRTREALERPEKAGPLAFSVSAAALAADRRQHR